MAARILPACRVCGKPAVSSQVRFCSDACRFWAKVERKGPDDCWEWVAKARGAFGYGAFRYQGRTTLSHRVAFRLEHGDPPRGAYVLHRCDNPACVNPAHLYLGDHAQNMADMKNRNRAGMKGRRHSPEVVARIVAARAANPPVRSDAGKAAMSAYMKERWKSTEWRAHMKVKTSKPRGPMSAETRARYAAYWASLKKPKNEGSH